MKIRLNIVIVIYFFIFLSFLLGGPPEKRLNHQENIFNLIFIFLSILGFISVRLKFQRIKWVEPLFLIKGIMASIIFIILHPPQINLISILALGLLIIIYLFDYLFLKHISK